jgi:hypothetical protein
MVITFRNFFAQNTTLVLLLVMQRSRFYRKILASAQHFGGFSVPLSFLPGYSRQSEGPIDISHAARRRALR